MNRSLINALLALLVLFAILAAGNYLWGYPLPNLIETIGVTVLLVALGTFTYGAYCEWPGFEDILRARRRGSRLFQFLFDIAYALVFALVMTVLSLCLIDSLLDRSLEAGQLATTTPDDEAALNDLIFQKVQRIADEVLPVLSTPAFNGQQAKQWDAKQVPSPAATPPAANPPAASPPAQSPEAAAAEERQTNIRLTSEQIKARIAELKKQRSLNASDGNLAFLRRLMLGTTDHAVRVTRQDTGTAVEILVWREFHRLQLPDNEALPESDYQLHWDVKRKGLIQQAMNKANWNHPEAIAVATASLAKQDSALTNLRAAVNTLRDKMNDSTRVWWLFKYPAIRARAVFHDTIQYITYVAFWIGVLLIVVAISGLDRQSQNFIEQFGGLADAVDSEWKKREALERTNDYEPSKDPLRKTLGAVSEFLQAPNECVKRCFFILRGCDRPLLLPDPSGDRNEAERLQARPRLLARVRTIRRDELPAGRVTDDEVLEKLAQMSLGSHPPTIVHFISEVLTASVSSAEYGSLANTRDSLMSGLRDATDRSLEFCRYAVWVLPSLGFIGTIVGISAALMQSDRMVSAPPERTAQEVSAVTEYLGMAFDTTLVSLVLSMFLVMLVHLVQVMSEGKIEQTSNFLDAHVIKRLRPASEVVDDEEEAFGSLNVIRQARQIMTATRPPTTGTQLLLYLCRDILTPQIADQHQAQIQMLPLADNPTDLNAKVEREDVITHGVQAALITLRRGRGVSPHEVKCGDLIQWWTLEGTAWTPRAGVVLESKAAQIGAVTIIVLTPDSDADAVDVGQGKKEKRFILKHASGETTRKLYPVRFVHAVTFS